jgi:hypothetical protein
MKCCFCNQDETMQHLFFECPLAKIVLRFFYVTFNIIPPNNMTNLFGNWLHGVNKQDKAQIRVGTCALLWAIWNPRINDIIFNRSKQSSFFRLSR